MCLRCRKKKTHKARFQKLIMYSPIMDLGGRPERAAPSGSGSHGQVDIYAACLMAIFLNSSSLGTLEVRARYCAMSVSTCGTSGT